MKNTYFLNFQYFTKIVIFSTQKNQKYNIMKRKIVSVRANNGFDYSETNTLAFQATQIFRFSENQKDKDLKKELVLIMRKIVKIQNEISYCKISTNKAVLNLIRFAYEYSSEVGKRVSKLFNRESFNPNDRQIEI